jgi:hypothetical protein
MTVLQAATLWFGLPSRNTKPFLNLAASIEMNDRRNKIMSLNSRCTRQCSDFLLFADNVVGTEITAGRFSRCIVMRYTAN